MIDESKKCQSYITNSKAILDPFLEEISHTLNLKEEPLHLKLADQQLPLFASLFSPKHTSAIYALDGTPSILQATLKATKAWGDACNVNHHWRLILDHIAEQEIAGDVVTDLSITMHYFMQSAVKPGYSFFIPTTLIKTLTIPDPVEYQANTKTVSVGQTVEVQSLIKHLADQGYTRHSKSLEPGSSRIRGEQIDVYHPTYKSPITLTFLRNTVESITQQQDRRRIAHNSVVIPPNRFPKTQIPLYELINQYTLIKPNILTELSGRQNIIHDATQIDIPFPFEQTQETQQLTNSNTRIALYKNKDRVQEYIEDQGLTSFTLCESPLAEIPLKIHNPSIAYLSEEAIFPQQEEVSTAPIDRDRAFELIGALEVGKPAVHADHGIGMFEGLQARTIEDIEREYLIIRYAEGDVLSTPVEYAHKITPYVGESNPPIYRLGGTLWNKARSKAKEDAVAFAKELLATASKRHTNQRPSLTIQQSIEDELEQTFPFDLTADQKRSWEEIKEDLQKPEPMDRLVVGDVGFGKTEIAIRAARHVIANGKQVAVLAPTTLLVQQHADTFIGRLPDMKENIGVLSRFSTPKELDKVKQAIAAGGKNIIIGTHALLSPSIEWQNLGLIIIDEEQQFGVRQKEHFKKIRATMDILSLSATPIPRTLSMALSGLRSLSLITTAPPGRRSVETYVGQLGQSILKKAVTQELDRDGQVYVVAPKVRQLASISETIKEIAPKAKTAIAHGQLPSKQLSDIMHAFDQGEIDILISSSIIENGLDLPNANTLIVWQATHFGLSDLYQLRGRVGRRKQQGYAYFLYKQTELTSTQRQRLTALTEASRLGSGWTIARRDLEIRGAGNLIGSAQSGSANAVGVQLYLDMVQQATQNIDEQVNSTDVDIQLPFTAIIPTHYIAETNERSRWYQKLARSNSISQLEERVNELQKAYGDIPTETKNLVLQLKLQKTASASHITKITSKAITPSDEDPYARIEVWSDKTPETLHSLSPLGNWVVRGDHISLDVDDISIDLIKKIIEHLSQ